MDWKFSSCRTAREWFDCGRVKLYTSRRSQFSVPFLLPIYRTISFDWANSRFGPIVLFFKQLAVFRRFQAVSRPAWRSGGSTEVTVTGDLNQFRYLRRVYNLWQSNWMKLYGFFFFFLLLFDFQLKRISHIDRIFTHEFLRVQLITCSWSNVLASTRGFPGDNMRKWPSTQRTRTFNN
jgi:hypothetical protein